MMNQHVEVPANNQTKHQKTGMTYYYFGAIILYLFLYILPIGFQPLIIPDETRYAEIPREMLASSDWIVPHLNGLRYFEKPPFGYWLNAISLSVFVDNEFAVRLPVALAAGLAVLATFLFAIKTTRNTKTALFAAMIYMTFFEVFGAGTFVSLDTYLNLALTTCVMFFYLALQEEHSRAAYRYALISGICAGIAFMTKGFLAFAVPVIVFAPWLLLRRQLFKALPLIGWTILSAMIVSLPWSIAIYLREGDFWHYFFWVEHINRFLGNKPQHTQPLFFYILSLPLLAFPWFSVAPAAIKGLFIEYRNNNRPPVINFLILWFTLPLLFFSVSHGKLPTYILPCFPPLAILLSIGLLNVMQCKATRWLHAGLVFNLTVFALLLVAIYLPVFSEVKYQIFNNNEWLNLAALTFALMLGIGFSAWVLLASSSEKKIFGIIMSVAFMFSVLHFIVPEESKKHKTPGIFITSVADNLSADTVLISDSGMIHAVNWYLKRDDVYLLSEGELEYGIRHASGESMLLNKDSMNTLLQNQSSSHGIIIICKIKCAIPSAVDIPPHSVRRQYGMFESWCIEDDAHKLSCNKQ